MLNKQIEDEGMQFKTIKKIKLELKRLRNRQNTHKDDAKVARRKSHLKSKLRKLLKEPLSTTKFPSSRGRAESEEIESSGKTKGSDSYI